MLTGRTPVLGDEDVIAPRGCEHTAAKIDRVLETARDDDIACLIHRDRLRRELHVDLTRPVLMVARDDEPAAHEELGGVVEVLRLGLRRVGGAHEHARPREDAQRAAARDLDVVGEDDGAAPDGVGLQGAPDALRRRHGAGTGAAFTEHVSDFIDVDSWLRGFAFGVLNGMGDNFTQGDQHNAMFYVRPSDGRVVFFAKDLDAFRKQGWRIVVAALITLFTVFFSAVLIAEVCLRIQGFPR